MRSAFVSLLAAILICSTSPRGLQADGGQVRLSQSQGDTQITVFTSPTPLRAGQVDVSVMLQRESTGQVVADADVSVELTCRDQPEIVIRAAATGAAATNRLLQAAVVDLPHSGWWDVRVACRLPDLPDGIDVGFAMQAGPPIPAWLSLWGWFGWPALVVLLFVIHRLLVARRRRRLRDE